MVIDGTDFKGYVSIGEEAVQNTKQVVTVADIPVNELTGTGFIPEEKKRGEWRGDDVRKGETHVDRMSVAWENEWEVPVFSETSTVTNGYEMVFNHFFTYVNSTQNSTTGQYYNRYYVPDGDPFAAANLGTKALTMSPNFSEGDTVKNHPLIGGRVTSLKFTQETNEYLMLSFPMVGQTVDAAETETGTPVYPAEELRYKYDDLKCYTGTITRVGTPPNYTDFTFGSATQFKPKDLNITFEMPKELTMELAGVNYPTNNKVGQLMVTVEFKIDWKKPASGFASVDEFAAWIADISETGMCFHWDTGVQAGSGDNHEMFIDCPRMRRMGGEPEPDRETGSAEITLKYEGLVDSTALYQVMILRKNTVDMS